ncbi:MAG: hypothetical protein U0790_25245 [Isosphaeraceae bacterium]
MADTAISDLASYSSVATNDLLVVVDVSDTSMAASGTNKKATISQLSSIIDAAIGSTRGSVLYRGASGWVVLTPGASGSILVSRGAGADPAWSSTGLNITQHIGTTQTPADGATITCDLSAGDYFIPAALGGNRTLALSNPTVDQQFTIVLTQDATGGRTVTWFSGILWANGDIPILTTTPGKRDVFTFKCISSGVYLGWVVGLNH